MSCSRGVSGSLFVKLFNSLSGVNFDGDVLSVFDFFAIIVIAIAIIASISRARMTVNI